jgi:hypothetical protein
VPADTPTKPPQAPRQRLPLNAAVPRLPDPPADLLAIVEKERERGGSAEQTPSPKSSKRAGLRFEVGSLKELGQFLLVLSGIALGLVNHFSKAEAPVVARVDDKAEVAKRAIDGDSQAQEPAAERGLRKRVADLEAEKAAAHARSCRHMHWQAEVLRLQTPPVFVTLDEACDEFNGDKFEAKKGESMPSGGKPQIVVTTPMPKP